MIYHISKNGSDRNDGSENAPFLTVNQAAGIAVVGDTVIVHEGIYRERICPVNGGLNEASRITYKAANGEKVIIKGSEPVGGWVKKDGIWLAEIPNTLFTEANPFETKIDGDWIEVKAGEHHAHTAAVYSDGTALSEQYSIDDVKASTMTWFAEVGEKSTTVYANFGDTTPEIACVEVNVRSCLFAPTKSGVNYITVSGFEFAHAATNWAPPTASQEGAVWARWCKGWII